MTVRKVPVDKAIDFLAHAGSFEGVDAWIDHEFLRHVGGGH